MAPVPGRYIIAVLLTAAGSVELGSARLAMQSIVSTSKSLRLHVE
jgi:hypothetical protein